jgi:hypothetical protein
MSRLYRVQTTIETVILVEDNETPENVLKEVASFAFRDSLDDTDLISRTVLNEIKSINDLPGKWSGVSIPYSTDLYSAKILSSYLE